MRNLFYRAGPFVEIDVCLPMHGMNAEERASAAADDAARLYALLAESLPAQTLDRLTAILAARLARQVEASVAKRKRLAE